MNFLVELVLIFTGCVMSICAGYVHSYLIFLEKVLSNVRPTTLTTRSLSAPTPEDAGRIEAIAMVEPFLLHTGTLTGEWKSIAFGLTNVNLKHDLKQVSGIEVLILVKRYWT